MEIVDPEDGARMIATPARRWLFVATRSGDETLVEPVLNVGLVFSVRSKLHRGLK